jgi:hypothetical protein
LRVGRWNCAGILWERVLASKGAKGFPFSALSAPSALSALFLQRP